MDDIRGEVRSSPAPDAGWRTDVAFLRRALILTGIVVAVVLLWWAREALLLAFGGVVVAVVLLATAEPFKRRLGLGHRASVAAAGGSILVMVALAGLLIGGQVRAQVSNLGEALPRAVGELEGRLGLQLPAGIRDAAGVAQDRAQGTADQPPPPPERGGSAGNGSGGGLDAAAVGGILGRIANFGAVVLDALASLVLAVVVGVFLAAHPALYRRGLVKLFPRHQHARVEDALLASGRALRAWLLAALLAMAIVGALAGLGAWALGLPAPLAIALFAGLSEFVPVIGSILGAVPALLLALGLGADTFLWTLLLFVAIQQLEGAVITPLVQERVVHIPPALILVSIVAFGAILGLPGVVLAAPLTVVAVVLVKKLYLREALGEATEVPGEREDN